MLNPFRQTSKKKKLCYAKGYIFYEKEFLKRILVFICFWKFNNKIVKHRCGLIQTNKLCSSYFVRHRCNVFRYYINLGALSYDNVWKPTSIKNEIEQRYSGISLNTKHNIFQLTKTKACPWLNSYSISSQNTFPTCLFFWRKLECCIKALKNTGL